MVDLQRDPAAGKLATAIRFPFCADFHPLKYIQGVARAAGQLGAQIFEHTFATSIHDKVGMSLQQLAVLFVF